MKRYWKIISICLVTLIVIGTFYIQSSFATNEHITIEFEKINGSEDEVKGLILSGDYLVGHNYQALQITSEETSAQNNLSFLQRLERLSVPPHFKGLVDKYKNFMRGKDLTTNHFFENENVLAYASIKADNLYEQPMKGLAFTIEVLDKKSKEVTSIELDVPERKNYIYMYVEHVQVINGELKIITQGYGMDNTDELHVYTIDLKAQKLVNDDVIVSSPLVVNGWSDVRILNHVESFEWQKHFLIQVEAYEEGKVETDGESQLIANEYMIYDIENNQSKKIGIPEEIIDSIAEASVIIDSTLFSPSQSINGFEINQYDIVNEKWADKLTFESTDMKDEESRYMTVMDGKLFAVYTTDDGQNLLIGNLETGKSLYEGKLHVKNQGEGQGDHELYIHEAELVP